jgi:D-alanyl-D-alanine carboxypeptidase
VAEVKTGRKRRPPHRFRIGSTTKAFVATVMLQLVAERKMSLDDTMEKWLPGLVRGNGHDDGTIIIRHLLNNTSGIFDYLQEQEAINRYPNPTPSSSYGAPCPIRYLSGPARAGVLPDQLRSAPIAPQA